DQRCGMPGARSGRLKRPFKELRAHKEARLRARLDQAAIFERAIRLQGRGEANAMLCARPAHGRNAVARSHRARVDEFLDLPGDLLVESRGIGGRTHGVLSTKSSSTMRTNSSALNPE